MKNTNYDNKVLEGKEYEECEFVNCSFIETTFKKCRFIDCKFKNCRISALKPVDSTYIEVSFSGSKVEGVDWTKAEIVRELSFENCSLNYSNFNMLKLPKIKIVNCEAKEVTFSETDLSEANLEGTDFEKSVFFKTNLSKASLKNAKNYWIDIMVNKLTGASFSLPDAIDLLKPLKIKVN